MSGESVGIVTVTYGSGDVIEEFLDSLLAQTHTDFELISIDNASTDNTLELISGYSSERITVIANDTNIGIAAGNNQGIRYALEKGYDYVLLINNDTVFEPRTLEKLIEAQKEHGCDLVVPKIMFHEEPEVLWFAGGYLAKNRSYTPYHVGTNEEDRGQYDTPGKITYSPTCCMLIKSSVFDDIGFMDEKYFVYFDDTDFCYRVMMSGKHCMLYYPFIEFYHKVGSLTKGRIGDIRNFKEGPFKIRYMTRNQVYYCMKQKSLFSRLYIVYFYFKSMLRFFTGRRISPTWYNFKLLHSSFFEGLALGFSRGSR